MNTTQKFTEDIFMDQSFLEKLPKGWNYSKVRAYLIRVKKNPERYTKEQIETAYQMAKFLANFYNNNKVIDTPRVKGLFAMDRWNTMNNLSFHLMFVAGNKKSD